MDLKESCPSVSIPSSDEHRVKKKRFTVYKVLVSVGSNEWFVFRRYAEFDKLYNTLRKQFPTMNLKIPAKRIFGDNFDPDFIKQRRAGLNEFIQNLVRQSELCNHPDVRSFLQMDNPKHQYDPSEDEDERNSQKLNSTSQNINLGPSGNPHAKPTDFDFLKVIGKGSFGKVLLAKRKWDGKFYAVKVLQKKIVLNRKEQKHIMAERNVLLKNVKHPFLVGLHYSFQTIEKLYFVLDFVNGGELFFHLQKERTFPEHRAKFYAAEIASALGYLHSIKIVYRDLKPENILLDSLGHVVLTDFGLCKEGIATSDTTATFCGTPEYLAPEVIRKQPYDNTVDWWCLGAVLYEMLYGLPPFYCRDVAEMYESILHKPLRLRPGVSLTAWSILEELLEKERQNRLGSKEDFLEIQRHPFFESVNWNDLLQKKIPPPFNPNVFGPDDIRNFDATFTEEMVPCSICISSDYNIVNASVLEADDAFIGFSYAPPSEDLFH
ncbi:serine/threonine-protein kinase Sgk3 isoform X1 [Protobothrops mucrosquamatus]|uniref:serine/threonine-protein kinase Sgk3 isoform X1 n=1 Tax=Protobothrops mucrosquamatus TaxID=103944 RepID=UPI000775C243|nr:serine/threonine-protein kinase Sgk3 isoform X1 [Protobothrops mucrosquamatus]XP_015679898.1 serine/threonine-protein kinase Sgk3 isoform X1 [Protobothrops mucrosquamatus]